MKKRIINNSSSNAPSKPVPKGEVLGAQLRENLKRRKAQARAQGKPAIKQIKEI